MFESNDKKIIEIPLFRIISVVIIIIALIVLYRWHCENTENEKIASNFVEENNIITPDSTSVDGEEIHTFHVNFDELLKKNSNTIGWIKVNNTNIDYPIVQHSDNSYYLTHNFENSYNSAGWIFLDYRNSVDLLNQNTIIYGHNRRNNSMFGTLKNALDSSWCDNLQNRFIMFNTIYHEYVAQIFSVYKVKSKDFFNSTSFDTNEAYQNYLNDITQKSNYNFNLPVSSKDKILTLYTCDNNSSYRIIVHAKILL